MSRCRQTDALLDAAFAGTQLTRARAAHAAHCVECARALARARRFEAELLSVGELVAPERLTLEGAPAVMQVGPGGLLKTMRRGLLGSALVTVVFVAVAMNGGGWLGEVTSGFFAPANAIPPRVLNSWLDRALDAVIDETGRHTQAIEWEPTQVETCGRTAIAFYQEKDADGVRAYRWAVGEPMNRIATLRAGGLAGSLWHPEVAELRAQMPVCDVSLDASLTVDETMAALDGARRLWETEVHGFGGSAPIPETRDLVLSRVMEAAQGAPHDYLVLLERPNRTGIDRIGIFEETDDSFRVQNASSDAGFVEPSVVYRESTSLGFAYFGVTEGSEIRAVELVGPTQTLRYSVSSQGFILQLADMPKEITAFRLLDASGDVRSEGEIETWCGEPSERALPECRP
jgi:hypothetical protein